MDTIGLLRPRISKLKLRRHHYMMSEAKKPQIYISYEKQELVITEIRASE